MILKKYRIHAKKILLTYRQINSEIKHDYDYIVQELQRKTNLSRFNSIIKNKDKPNENDTATFYILTILGLFCLIMVLSRIIGFMITIKRINEIILNVMSGVVTLFKYDIFNPLNVWITTLVVWFTSCLVVVLFFYLWYLFFQRNRDLLEQKKLFFFALVLNFLALLHILLFRYLIVHKFPLIPIELPYLLSFLLLLGIAWLAFTFRSTKKKF